MLNVVIFGIVTLDCEFNDSAIVFAANYISGASMNDLSLGGVYNVQL